MDQWERVSSSPNTTIEFISNNMNLQWNGDNLSENPNLTIDFILQNPEIKWNYENISKNLFTYHPDLYKIKLSDCIKKTIFIIQPLKTFLIKYL